MSKTSDRRALWIAVVVLAAVVFCLWLFPSAKPIAPSPSSQATTSPSSTEFTSPPKDTPSAATDAVRPKRRLGKPIAPELARLRVRVLDSLAGEPKDGTEKSSRGPSAPAAEQKPGEIKDRTGELNPETMRVLNDEFMPLVRECYDLAHQRNPQLRGMLALDIELAGAEELGTIIETVEPAQARNELDDDELIECVRQSAFSIELPMPLKSGRVSRQLTLNFGGADEPPK